MEREFKTIYFTQRYTIKIKPCILCGKVKQDTDVDDKGVKIYQFFCNCGRGSSAYDKVNALGAWNAQAGDREAALASRKYMEQIHVGPFR